MKRVTGLGGIFFKSENPAELKKWYKEHLHVSDVFRWKEIDQADPTKNAATAWSPFKKETDYFKPSEKQFMINYRVENLDALLDVLKAEGVQVLGKMDDESYGKFGWILDPEGNKIELWEPKG